MERGRWIARANTGCSITTWALAAKKCRVHDAIALQQSESWDVQGIFFPDECCDGCGLSW